MSINRRTYSRVPRTLLVHSAEFQSLSAPARLCLYDLKAGYGSSCTIALVLQPLVEEMAHTTGLPEADVRRGLEELEAGAWIGRTEDSVLLRDQWPWEKGR